MLGASRWFTLLSHYLVTQDFLRPIYWEGDPSIIRTEILPVALEGICGALDARPHSKRPGQSAFGLGHAL